MATPDLSEFEQLARHPGPKCAIRTVLSKLENDDRETLEAALSAEHITSAQISRWISKRGLKASPCTVQRHQRKDCSCD